MTRSRDHWRPAYVGIGSNLEEPAAQVQGAFASLKALPESDPRFTRRSPMYRSAPMGPADQPDFVNAAAVLLTRLGPRDLMDALQAIETSRGRRRDIPHWGPRVLDLDLLVLGNLTVDEPDLRIPHPGIAERNFVLCPLADIAPHMYVPRLGSVLKLLAEIGADAPRIERLDERPE